MQMAAKEFAVNRKLQKSKEISSNFHISQPNYKKMISNSKYYAKKFKNTQKHRTRRNKILLSSSFLSSFANVPFFFIIFIIFII